MLIFDDIKLVYLANPKTGTTAFEAAFTRFANPELSNALPKHAPYRKLKRSMPALCDTHEIVACVREPLEALYSWYRYRRRPEIIGTRNSTLGMTFEAFVGEWCKDKPAACAQVNASVSFILNQRGLVPKRLSLFLYGSSPTIADYVGDKLDQPIVPNRKNVSRKPDPEELAMVRESPLLQSPKMQDTYRIFRQMVFVNSSEVVTEAGATQDIPRVDI